MAKVSKKEPLISVIIPIYKVEDCLDRCVESIVNQIYQNLEIILVDDGSLDNCPKMCDEWAKKDKRIKVVHKENGGLSDARNAGLDIAKGDYVSFVDSDDYIEKDCFSFMLEQIRKDETDMVIASHKVVFETGKSLKPPTFNKMILEPKKVFEKILYNDGVDLSAWAKLYKKSIFKDIRFPKGRLFEDAATTYKLIDKCKIITVESHIVYNYIIRNNSITGEKFTRKKMDLILSTNEMCDYILKKYPSLEAGCRRRKMYAYLNTLSKLATTKEKFPKEQKELITYIKKNGIQVIKDENAPLRDKIAIFAANCGFNIYKIFWKCYQKIVGKI